MVEVKTDRRYWVIELWKTVACKVIMPTTTQNTLMEKQVEDSLKRFDAAVRASTTRLVCKDDEEEQDKRNDLDQEEESLEALASRITAYDSGRKAAQGKTTSPTLIHAM